MKGEILLTFTAFFFMSLTALTGAYADESNRSPSAIISEKRVDVTGDRKKDTVYLKANHLKEGVPFSKSISIEVKSQNGQTNKIELEGGYEPEADYQDLNRDGVKDIFVSILTGESGGLSNFHLYTLKNSNVVDLPVPEPLSISSQFLDGYRASISIEETGQSYTFNLSERKMDYDHLGLYQDGNLNEPTELIIQPYAALKPIKIKGKGLGLTGSQRVSGVFNADGIALVESTWIYENSKWTLVNTKVKSLKLHGK
ncbi:hypothetical protein [Bacillus sp. REN3]|uniref:hypothetical protein n=1 Tax=Bacillus sp. REN3 TaxID=2802440 RepID=UPI001AEDA1F6|nr:hypothetical protein [Bacillus sp. REN3]